MGRAMIRGLLWLAVSGAVLALFTRAAANGESGRAEFYRERRNCGCDSLQRAVRRPLYLIKHRDRYGYIDSTGFTVVQPQFELARDYYDGRAWFRTNVRVRRIRKGNELEAVALEPRWGMLDEGGNIILRPLFVEVEDFFGGRAQVYEDSVWGFVDLYGREYVEPTYEAVAYYCNGYAAFARPALGYDRLAWGYLDQRGGVALAPFYFALEPFADLRARVLVFDRWGYLAPEGRIVIEPVFDEAGDFYEGRARVKRYGWWAFIDRAGQLVTRYEYDEVADFSDGRARVFKDGRWRLIDTTGRTVVQFVLERPLDFSEGRAPVVLDNRWGYIDRHGGTVIPTQYGEVRPFSEARAWVWGYGAWRLVDPDGQTVLPERFDQVEDFYQGLARVWDYHQWGTDEWGYVNRSGRVVWYPQ